jgi:hypothetical protein
MNVENVLYQNTCNNYHSFYLIIIKGDYYNSAVELSTFNNKLISNETLSTYKKLEFNKENIEDVLNIMNVLDRDNISFDNFDVYSYNYITYKSKLINLNNWVDFYNFATTII